MADYKNLNNQEYWAKRTEERVDKYWKDMDKVEARLGKEYQTATTDIKNSIADLYASYASENGLEYTESIKLLNTTEINDYRNQINTLTEGLSDVTDPAILKEIELLKSTRKLSRLQASLNKINARLLNLGYMEQITTKDWLAEAYQGNYYHTLHEVTTGIGFMVDFHLLNERAIKTAITYPWSGAMFSDNIWENKRLLIKNLKKTITQGLIKGKSYKDMAKDLNKSMNTGMFNASRVIRTETATVVNTATGDGYEEAMGSEGKYIIIATLDRRTSSICQKQDQKVYLLKDRKIGVNMSPFHVNCRSTMSIYFDDGDDLTGTRFAKDADGNNIKVPKNMNYDTWFKTYIDKN